MFISLVICGLYFAFKLTFFVVINFSNGCLHVHPDDMKTIDSILINDLDVKPNVNPFGKNPYPYPCQGLMSIQQIDLINV